MSQDNLINTVNNSLPADDNLIMHLKFDEVSGTTAADSSPNGSDNFGKLLKGASFQDVGGDFGGVVEFDGENDYIHVNDSLDLNLSLQGKRTVSLWFKADDVDLSNGKQILYEEGGETKGLNIYIDDGSLYVGGWHLSNSNWNGTYLSSDAISDDTWHHVALVLDGKKPLKQTTDGAFQAYLDGELIGSGAGSHLWKRPDNVGIGGLNQSTKFHDGSAKGSGTNTLDGMIEDVRVYNQALTADEIKALFEYNTAPEQLTEIPLRMGVNLRYVTDNDTLIPFIDLFKMSIPWIPQNDQNSWIPEERDLLDLDEHDWVKSLPDPEAPEEYDKVSTRIFNQINGNFPDGKYIVLYDGEGTIKYGWNVIKDKEASSPGRDVISVNRSTAASLNAGIYLTITETDPYNNGDYIRNIRIVQEQYEDLLDVEIFNPDYVDFVDDFEAIRFVTWMVTNSSEQSEWSDRPTPENASFNYVFNRMNAVPVEYMVELANQAQVDPWFTLPHMATDEYVYNFAQYVKDNLDPNLEVYVQYSNETWQNITGFDQYKWILEQGKKEWPNYTESNGMLVTDWYSKRTTEITQIWDEVFGEDKDRVKGVMAVNSAHTPSGQRAINYYWSDSPKSHEEYGVDVIAIGAYFGSYMGFAQNEAEVTSWTKDPDGGLDKLFDEITQGGVLSNGPKGGALERAYKNIQDYVALANEENLELVAYEAGQHLAGIDNVKNNKAIVKLFTEANRDPRMGEIYREFFPKWYELGGGLILHYGDISTPTIYGSWGLVEYMNQPREQAYKYDAIMDLIEQSPVM